MKKKIKYLLFFCLLFMGAAEAHAAQIDYWRSDSIKVMKLFRKAHREVRDSNYMLFFGRQLIGLPYVAKTLDQHKEEQLVVNLRQFDCTTLVETVLALSECMKRKTPDFTHFCKELALIRYRDGIVSYPTRQHYFTYWINQNVRKRLVTDLQGPVPPFTAKQLVSVNYMTTHPSAYPMLKMHPNWIGEIRKMEDSITGHTYRYIPKAALDNSALLRSTIHNGDIIVILTSKRGLDTSHIGIAVWHADGLHLLNASAIRHHVVEEPKLFRTYMMEHPTFTGIRVVRAI